MNDITELFSNILQLERALPSPLEVVCAIGLSFLLSSLIAAVYKATYRGANYSQDYVHTLIIFGMVVSVIIMVVRGDAAIAFGMFAAFSIIRFRRTLPHARDIAFIFFSMAAGMSVGARHYQLAILTTVVICAIIYVFSRYHTFAPEQISHFLRVRVTHDIDTDSAFNECFAGLLERADLLSVGSIQAGMMTELRYAVRLRGETTPHKLVAAVQEINGNNRVMLTTAPPDSGWVSNSEVQ